MMLEDGHRRGDRCYDLGTGSHDTKQAWRTSMRTSYRFTFFSALVFRAQLLRWNRWLRRRLHGEHDIACSRRSFQRPCRLKLMRQVEIASCTVQVENIF